MKSNSNDDAAAFSIAVVHGLCSGRSVFVRNGESIVLNKAGIGRYQRRYQCGLQRCHGAVVLAERLCMQVRSAACEQRNEKKRLENFEAHNLCAVSTKSERGAQ